MRFDFFFFQKCFRFHFNFPFLDLLDIYDESKDKTGDLSPAASVVASRATKMVEMLSCDNVALREKLESVYLKLNNLQMVREKKRNGWI